MAADRPYRVHKFGGSSVADAACFERVAAIVRDVSSGTPTAVVVSAMRGMTDTLLSLADSAELGDTDFAAAMAGLGERYETAACRLLDPDSRGRVIDGFHADLGSLTDVLKAVALVRSAPERSRDMIAGFGELWSSRLLAALLEQTLPGVAVRWLDAREALTIRKTKLGPAVLWERSAERLGEALGDYRDGVVVITGFIAADEQGLQANLGRNGSDFSASIFAALLKAKDLTIWTDVDGVLSADPRRVPEARVIGSVSYNEAMELAYFGAKVIHPQTMGPAVDHDIPILIRNTFRPDAPGTQVIPVSGRDELIKGI
ncbi:MAG: aspartate kinase, partial [Pseudomonadota bacterium]